jgi:hypothetical protein
MRRHALKKDGNQAALVRDLERIGCAVFVMHEPCDLLVGFRGRTWAFEVKNPGQPVWARKLTPAQVRFRDAWAGRGQFDVVETVDDVLAVFRGAT